MILEEKGIIKCYRRQRGREKKKDTERREMDSWEAQKRLYERKGNEVEI